MSKSRAEPTARGRCLCGAVSYTLHGPLRGVVNCHCGQCLHTHGHFAAYTNVRRADLHFEEDRGLKWYESSERARRGFCGECGASLFWDRRGGDSISVAAGTLDRPTGLKTVANIFVADKGDYYEIEDGLPSHPGTMNPT